MAHENVLPKFDRWSYFLQFLALDPRGHYDGFTGELAADEFVAFYGDQLAKDVRRTGMLLCLLMTSAVAQSRPSASPGRSRTRVLILTLGDD